MKTRYTLSLFCVLASTALYAKAGDTIAPPHDNYSERLEKYSDTAERDLRGIRSQIEAATNGASQTVRFRYNEVYTQLDQCQQLLGEVKIADSHDVDVKKAS